MNLFFSDTTIKVLPIKADDVQSAVRMLEKNSGQFFVQQNLVLERESLSCPDQTCPTVSILFLQLYFIICMAFVNNCLITSFKN